MGTLRFFEEVVSFKIRRTFGFADYSYKAGEKQVRRFFSPQASRFSPMFPIQANQHFLMRNARFQVFVRYDLESE